MNRTLLIVAGIVIIALGIVAASAAFIVRETEQALVLQFGDPIRVIQDPGLQFKVPFIQDVTYYDSRVLDYDHPAEEIIAADQKRLVVDSFIRYRISDPLEFYKAVGTELAARARLAGIVSASLRRAVGNAPLLSVLSEERADIMAQIQADTNEAAGNLGLEVVDFRIRRADLPQANAEAIYQRMQSEREREAREFRAQGAEIAQRIRARAERERTVLLAESRRQAQVLRGEGDSEAIRLYADAFGRDPEFFAFYRSMEAYRKALNPGGTTMVLSPDSDFFAYFGEFAPRQMGPVSLEPSMPSPGGTGPSPGGADMPPLAPQTEGEASDGGAQTPDGSPAEASPNEAAAPAAQ